MKHRTIRVGQDEVRCLDCGRQWDADDEAPEDCREDDLRNHQNFGAKPKQLTYTAPPPFRLYRGPKQNKCLPTPVDKVMGRDK